MPGNAVNVRFAAGIVTDNFPKLSRRTPLLARHDLTHTAQVDTPEIARCLIVAGDPGIPHALFLGSIERHTGLLSVCKLFSAENVSPPSALIV